MATTIVTARDEIFELFERIWARAPSVGRAAGPYPSVLEFNDTNQLPEGSVRKPWARLNMTHHTGRGTSVSGRRQEHAGTIRVAIFVPKTVTSGPHVAQLLAQLVLDGFSRHSGAVQLSAIRHNDVPADGGFARQDVVCQFKWITQRSMLDG